ncbi:S-layer family protein [Nostoc sp. FACHB-110]|uniref:two-partner secretion domain-containing protein n=1 Tax=Nostoc sp. FACHB-110 TaxID=2692834 RepID=UPI0016867382|nr:S-layer family protein [Nostoc sp. FACHB-110]MBD2441047.1 S-layer family protein [Nostoc sp. FACHB-110]
MKVAFAGFGCLSAICIWTFCSNGVHAQVTSDNTFKTVVESATNSYTIKYGTRVGNNLFHSFSQFSIPTNSSASFDNVTDIQNIFSRVTGGNISNIDGSISANGKANLFLLNPAGIIFGKNASLSIGGSFIGTTANSIKFDDGNVFSTDRTQSPVLTMKVPIGLQLGNNAGAIQVQGKLEVPTGKTLALVGSQIDLTKASLIAPNGWVELWAGRNADIKMDNPTGWQLASSTATADWGTISLQQDSLVDASGINGGEIYVQGRGLTLKDGSSIQSNTSSGQGRGITVKTTEFVDLLGSSSPGQIGRGLGTLINSGATGRAGDIKIETKYLRMTNGARLQSTTSGNNSRSGDIKIQATDIELFGANPFATPFGVYLPTDITTIIQGGNNNQAGSITIEAARIRTVNGGVISSDILNIVNRKLTATGRTGNISIRATESFEIAGGTPTLRSGVTTSVQPSGVGQAGNITIETGQLRLSNGGAIRSTLAGNGTAGNIIIQAKDVAVSDPIIEPLSQLVSGINTSVGKNIVGSGGTINLTADNLKVFNGGQITSSTQGQGSAGSINLQVKNLDIQGLSQPLSNGQILPSSMTASSVTNFAAGSVNIQADTVRVQDHAQITVSNIGTGDAGNLNLNARQIFLKNGASLRSEVNGGGQGNIQLQAKDVLLLRYGSKISANASGNSTGGNININAPIIVGLEDSDIIANAVQGRGGNILITTQGIIGLEYRSQLTPENDITASSQFGVNGIVAVNNVGVDPNSGLVELPANVTDKSQQIANTCDGNQGSSFVATGRGGIPQNPTQDISSDRTWSDTRNLTAFYTTKPAQAQIPKSPERLVQATSWRRNPQGKIELVANQSSTQEQQALTCTASLLR